MVQGCGMSCVKNLLFIFNFFFAISGIVIIVCGGYSLHLFKKTGPVIGEDYVSAPIILIVVGSIVFLVAFLGCCGAMQESYCMLMLFSVFLFLILVAEIAAGALGFVYKDKVEHIARERFDQTLQDYDREGEGRLKPIREAWDFIQHELKCCGVNGPNDWSRTKTHSPPGSCCTDGEDCTKQKTYYEKGCYDKVKEDLSQYAVYVGVAGIGIGLIEIIGIIFACCLANQVK
ncbi:leukocyte surface antigen CD53-like [Dermacentor andersoni]|uniref:leukocyte surface antigen CD53-like n=1 Tax=Dermacentor andersoni TaxID=34620 RepID=UPI0021559CCC|nr:leukocyte surface antigen CD53-like [Dermacentor andersoni]